MRSRGLRGLAILGVMGIVSAWPTKGEEAPSTQSGEEGSPFEGRSVSRNISGNPGAVNVTTGTGWLGRTLGIPAETGVTLGGVYLADGNYLFTGGANPRRLTGNSLLLLDFHVDMEKAVGWDGASFGMDFLQYNGGTTNENAGAVQGYNSLESAPPLNRTELYELWYRQSFLADKLIARIGKSVATYDFANIGRPVSFVDTELDIPSTSSLLYTPLYVNSAMLGVMPGYFDSAYGGVITVVPEKQYYVKAGIYDGSGAKGIRLGNRLTPEFDGYYFIIGEAGVSWLLGEEEMPGIFAVGGWHQTGHLGSAGGPQEDGTAGLYANLSQRLWYANPGTTDGIDSFWQFGWNDSETLLMNWFVGGGLTFFGMVPGRKNDSFGIGAACSGLNPNYYERDVEVLLQGYYQANLFGSVYLQPAITVIPEPGDSPDYDTAVAGTLRLVIAF